jgi:hypothetical protein
VPAHVAKIVARCLEKDPAQRPARAEELVEALGDTVSGRTFVVAGTRRRTYIGIGVAVIVLATTAGVVARMRTSGAAADERKIAVAPFRVGGAAPAVHYLREGLGDLMTPQLHAIPGVTAPSMRVMLEQWRRAGGSVDADLPDDRALRVAGGAGAGQLNEAIEALRTFVVLRAKADPRLQPEVAEARATLANLEKQSTGR